jgi:fumarate hydratase, class I
MTQPDLTEHFLELVRRTSTDLPPDVERALRAAREREAPESAAQGALDAILKNVELAREKSTPICQDTGTPIFYIYYPGSWSTRTLQAQIKAAVAQATAKAYLRPNAVDSLTGKNSGNNLGEAFPNFHFHESQVPYLQVDLMLKGGGSENVGAQYKLPDSQLGAGRNLEGVRRVVLDAIYQAQGKGCAPGVIGVAIGGARGSGYVKSKEQLFRELDDTNADPQLAELEARLTREANRLNIGPMGFGGETTVLGVKIGALHRVPASYFVSISYACWADRHRRLIWRDDTVTID